MTRFGNLTLSEFVDYLEAHLAFVGTRGPVDSELVQEAVNRLDECLGRFAQINDVIKGVVK